MVTPDDTQEKRLNLPAGHAPTSSEHRHTLGEALPKTTPTNTASRLDDSTALFTTVAVVVVLGVFILALFHMDKVSAWFGKSKEPTQHASARADAQFLKKARDLCAQYQTIGAIRAQTGKAEIRMDLPAEIAEPLAESLAVLYAQTRGANDAGHGATVTVISEDGRRFAATATDQSPPVAPPAPPPRPPPAAPVVRKLPRAIPPQLLGPTLVREEEEGEPTTEEPKEASSVAEPSPPLPPGTLADSVAGFSSTQGEGGWHYGYYPPPFAADGFEEMEVFDAWAKQSWSATSNSPPNAAIGRDTCQTDRRLWAVRRWVSPTNTTVHVGGQFRLIQGGEADWSIAARILADGRPVFARPLAANGAPVTCSARATVREGSTVDIVMENNAENENPIVRYEVRIEALAPPVLQREPD